MTPNSCLASHPCVDTTPPLNGGIVQQADTGDGSGVANISMTAVIHPNDEVRSFLHVGMVDSRQLRSLEDAAD